MIQIQRVHLLQALLALLLALHSASPACGRAIQTPNIKITGKARVVSITITEGQTQHVVLLQSGKNTFQLVEGKQGQLGTLRSGMTVTASGKWLASPAAGKAKAAAGALGPKRFQVAALQASGGKQAPRPTVTRFSPMTKAAVAAAKAAAAKAGTAAAGAASAGAVRALNLATMDDGTPLRLPLTANQPVTRDVSTLVIPIAGVDASGGACPGSSLPATSIADVKRAFFQEANRAGPTVGAAINQCSHGRSRLTSLNSMVAPLVRLPCASNDSWAGSPWTFSKCDFDDFNGWSDAADEALRARGVNLDRYKYRVYLLPPSQCNFVGLGYVGCDGSYTCRAWIGAGFWNAPADLAHELGHNLFLAHAGALRPEGGVDRYADLTSVMGYCCETRCLNTPQAWQMGWATLQQIDASVLPPGRTLTVRLASQALSQQSGLRIDTRSWAPGVDPLYLGYRTADRGDRGINQGCLGKVHLYSSPVTNSYDAQPSLYLAGLEQGQAWYQEDAGLVMLNRGVDGTAAVVSVCRIGGPETRASCTAGIDFDCNGLAGPDDPACAAFQGAA